jgi:hypothetical protein
MKIHIPTEQYGFVEADVDTPQDAKRLSDEIKSAFAIQVPPSEYDTLRTPKMNEIVDDYLLGKICADDYDGLNHLQKQVIQTIKRSLSRLKAKEN